MIRKLIIIGLVLELTWSASAAIIELDDSVLQTVTLAWGLSTLDAVIDIAGDPGTQYDVTWAATGGWSDIGLSAGGNNTEIHVGDTWEQEFYNPDSYATAVYLFAQVDGWNYYQSTGSWVNPGATATLSWTVPGTSVIDRVGFKFSTDTSTGRPDGGSGSIQVIPEPTTIGLLGLGGLMLRKRK